MATDVTKIHIGQGEIWIGGTAPAAGGDPNDPTTSTVNTMTSGFAAPTSGGTYVGFTNGPATLSYRPTFYSVETEQAFSEVIVTPTAEEAMLEFTMLEASYQNLSHALTQGTTGVDAGPPASNTIFVGSKATMTYPVLAMSSRKRTGVGYYLLTMYQVYSMEGASLNFERRAETQNGVQMKCLADTTRPIGDQLFQLAEFPADPA